MAKTIGIKRSIFSVDSIIIMANEKVCLAYPAKIEAAPTTAYDDGLIELEIYCSTKSPNNLPYAHPIKIPDTKRPAGMFVP